MTKKKVILVNTPELPCPGSHYFHTRKFLSSFEYYGFEYAEINKNEDINNISLNSNDVVYVSNHGFDHGNYAIALRQFLTLKKNNCNFILWHFHNHLGKELCDNLPERHVFTGEHFFTHHPAFDVYRNLDNFVSLKFLSPMSPEIVGKVARNPVYDAQFVGAMYQPQLMQKLVERYKIAVQYTPPFINEDDRIRTFLMSHCTLGFHAEDNIKKRLVTERVVEGLSFGCLVISDNPAAPEFTDGCAEYAQNFEEYCNFLDRAKNDDAWRIKKQNAGYEFVKSKGTYIHLAKDFMNKLGLK